MNIIAICGSPRRGNTEFALRRFLTKAEEFGHKTELVLLRERRVEHCSGCLSCDESGECSIMDDMKLIAERIQANDLIVFGSPNYFNNVSGIMKDFFDRLNPVYKSKSFAEKKMISLCIGASDNRTYPEKIAAVMESVAELLKLDFIGDFYLVARAPQDVENNPESIQKIDEFAKNILS
ncbi:MAG: flavodoxin family protein [Candidatus Paceibacterota bacterium]